MTGLVLSIGVCGMRIHVEKSSSVVHDGSKSTRYSTTEGFFSFLFTMIEKTKDQGQTIDQNGNV